MINYAIAKGELLRFKTKDGLILEGLLAKPKNSKLCVIHVHGWGGNFYRELGLWLIKKISSRGIAAFSINTRGHDSIVRIQKVAGRKMVKQMGGVNFEKFEESTLDIDGAINGLRRIGFKKFVLCGHSTGCQKITYYQLRKNNKSVIGLVLLAPGDDYNIWKRTILGKSFDKRVKAAKKLVKEGKGYRPNFVERESAKRFLSVADLKNIEARLFNYDGELKEFSRIKTPILAVFGSREEHALKPVSQYLKILKGKSNSKLFESHIVKGAMHSFHSHEEEVASLVVNFISKLQ